MRLLPAAHLSTQTSGALSRRLPPSGLVFGSEREEGGLLFFDVSNGAMGPISHGDGDVAEDGLAVFAGDVAVVVEVDELKDDAHLLFEVPEVEQPHAVAEFLE